MLFAILVFFTQVCVAQAYKYISMEDGLGSQKVYRILQDSLGYIGSLLRKVRTVTMARKSNTMN